MIDSSSAFSRSFTVSAAEEGTRLDLFLGGRLEGISREKIKAGIKKGQVAVDGRVCASPKQPVRSGQEIHAAFDAPAASLVPEEGEITVVYRDAALAVLDKPAGLTVHPCPSCPEGTLANRLAAHFPELLKQEGFRPGIVHRLDKDTSGLLLAALSEASRLALSALFAERRVYKEYLALVHGVPKRDRGELDAPLGRDPASKVKMAVMQGGKPARTAWRVLHADPDERFSLVAVRIFTGRTHQIRVHMAHLGHPLLGDNVYGANHGSGKQLLPGCAFRQMLHAWKLAFVHPFPGVIDTKALNGGASGSRDKGFAACLDEKENLLSFTCPPPRDFTDTLKILVSRPLKIVVTGMPGCGKSTLLKILEGLDAPVFSADAEVARLYGKDGDGTHLLRARYGERFMTEDEELDKTVLGEAMRASDALRREVESMIHPLVFHALKAFFARCEKDNSKLAIAEIPLFFETGGREKLGGDVVAVGVACPFPLRLERLSQNRGWSGEVVAAMESWQWPEEKKMAACDRVVHNAGTEEDLARKTVDLHSGLLILREERIRQGVAAIRRCWEEVVHSPCNLLEE